MALMLLSDLPYTAEVTQTTNDVTGAPDIEGPHVSFPVMPIEMNIDLGRIPIEVPLRQVPFPVIEVPLRQVPLPEGAAVVPAEKYPDGPPFLAQEAVNMPMVTSTKFSKANPNFDGIRLGDSGADFIPPDTNGDVGPNHYVQTVNSSIAIFNKQGKTLAGPMPINTLFAPMGGPCATGSIIDPVVNYDPLAGRWVVIGFPFASPICVAVSQTNNPVIGGWFLYAFGVTGFGFPDYPKLGVWPDAYYLTTQRGFPGGGLDVYALDRASMLNGNPATLVHFSSPLRRSFYCRRIWTGHHRQPAGQLHLCVTLTAICGVAWTGWRSLSSASISRIHLLPHSTLWSVCRPMPSVRFSVAVTFSGTAPSNRTGSGSKHCQRG